MSENICDHYGSMVFNDQAMRDKLPKPIYQELKKNIEGNSRLTIEVANAVAHAMKEWAIEKGATHYTHWFQPLTGLTSEKHDSFLTPKGDGTAIFTFSGDELIHGEPDASSFPSGGLRATFEARGYTAWDPTSFAFIKDEVLCIPTAFVSYTGEALDKKTPLLRSMDAISRETKRVLALFGKEVRKVTVTVGAEQEYFLIKEEDYQNRLDLILAGRTLFGVDPCKGQEMEDHYFGAIRPTVNRFMQELDSELWKLGIPVQTKHNEVAPSQHELVPLFQSANNAVDANLLTMEQMRKLASHHGLVCLQHEKPFEGINGSGKHNNWSLSVDGTNLLDPGSTPEENLQFLVILTAVIKAVDEYQGLLRMSAATAGNDLRLGANEAPPAIISIFLGDDLEAIVRSIIDATPYTNDGETTMDLGSPVLPRIIQDNTDRNRTSPFAFTGNKFEFRMPGSEANLSDANTVLNTIVAKTLSDFADALEGSTNFDVDAKAYMKKVLTDHQRIIYNGDNYTEDWIHEAMERGLLNLASTPEALPELIAPQSIALFERFGVLSRAEAESRYEVILENYSKRINIEGLVTARMTRARFIPAIIEFSTAVAASIVSKQAVSSALNISAEEALLTQLSDGLNTISVGVDTLTEALDEAQVVKGALERACAYRTKVIPAMCALRLAVDEMEIIVGHDYWPVPSYNHMLFYT